MGAVFQIEFTRGINAKILQIRKELNSNILYNTIMIVMAKLKKDIQRINFEVPVEYSDARALKEAVKSLPDWDEKIRESEGFNSELERIISKIKAGENLTPRELEKAILYFDSIPSKSLKKFDLIPSELFKKLGQIIIANEKSGSLEPIVLKLNRKFSLISSIRLFLGIEVMDDFNTKNFLPGLNRFKTDIVQGGWEGLIKGVIKSPLSFKEILNDFSINDEPHETSMTSLTKGIIELDKEAKKFESCAAEIAEFLFRKDESKDYITEKIDYYLGLFLQKDKSWEWKVIQDDYTL